MKCLMVNSVCGNGSTGRICTDIADVLAAQGESVKIAYGREPVPEKYRKYSLRIGTDKDIKLHGLSARCFDRAGFGSKVATEKFINWIKLNEPDVIHLHNLHGYYIHIKTLFDYLKTNGKRVIWTLHDCWPFTGHCPYFEYVECDKWRNGCKKCSQTREYPKSYLDCSAINWNKKRKIFTGVPDMTLVVPSQWLADLVKQSYLREYPVEVIHNGIDTETFYPVNSDIKDKYGITGKKIILGVASDWNYRKGLSYMVQLAEMLDSGYVVVVIGISDEQKKTLPENMIGILRTSNVQELVKWYSAAEVLFNPTLEDNYPTTNLEAIACGTPVVTFDSGGSPESAGLYGTVVHKGDMATVYHLIKEGNFEKKDIDLSVRRMVSQYIALYRGSKW